MSLAISAENSKCIFGRTLIQTIFSNWSFSNNLVTELHTIRLLEVASLQNWKIDDDTKNPDKLCQFPTFKNSYNVIGVAHAIVVCVGAIILLSRNPGLGPMMLILILRNQGGGLVMKPFLEILDRINS